MKFLKKGCASKLNSECRHVKSPFCLNVIPLVTLYSPWKAESSDIDNLFFWKNFRHLKINQSVPSPIDGPEHS